MIKEFFSHTKRKLQKSRRAGVVLTAIVGFSIIVQLSPALQRALEFDRVAIASGSWWRVVTGNFVHFSWLNLLADAGAFALLCWIAHRRALWTLLLTVLSSLAVGICIFLWADGITTYRGISGVDFAILAWLLVTMTSERWGWKAALYITVLLLFAGRAAFETLTGQTLLPTSLPDGVAVVGITHIAGIAVGSLFATGGIVHSRMEGLRQVCFAFASLFQRG